MKSGIAAATEALRVLHDTNTVPPCKVELQLMAEEEAPSHHDAKALEHNGNLTANACIVFEPNNLRLGVAERGTVMARITVTGTCAHGSNPAGGHLAIVDAGRIVTALHLREFGGPHHPLLGSATCNVDTIADGVSGNVVAGHCELVIRTSPPSLSDQAPPLARTPPTNGAASTISSTQHGHSPTSTPHPVHPRAGGSVNPITAQRIHHD